MSGFKSGGVLIVTHREAQEVDGVIDTLRSRQIEVTRWNLCEYPERATASVSSHAIGMNGTHVVTRLPFRAGWIHDCGAFSIASSPLTGLDREVALRESSSFWAGALAGLAIVWLNEPSRIEVASAKLLQLRVAQRLDIPIPDFCATNDSIEARRFVQSKGRVIAKAIRGGFVIHPDRTVKFFTRRVTEANFSLFSSLTSCPLLFQEEIARQQELRVTVVDGKCFSMSIDCAHLPDGVVDIRELDFKRERPRFARATNVEQIEIWSSAIVGELGLSYAALDWAISIRGEPYFLECNPLGSFKWSELCTGQNITQAIADTLFR